MNWLIGRVKDQLGWVWKFQTLREWSSEALVMAQGQLQMELTQEVWPIRVLISLPLPQGRGRSEITPQSQRWLATWQSSSI